MLKLDINQIATDALQKGIEARVRATPDYTNRCPFGENSPLKLHSHTSARPRLRVRLTSSGWQHMEPNENEPQRTPFPFSFPSPERRYVPRCLAERFTTPAHPTCPPPSPTAMLDLSFSLLCPELFPDDEDLHSLSPLPPAPWDEVFEREAFESPCF